MGGSGSRADRLSLWQWTEIALAAVLVWAQIIVQTLFGQMLVSALLGLVLLGVLVHIATWLIPMVRSKVADRSGALLGHGERVAVVVSGLCVLVLGILISCGGVLDLMARANHQYAPVGVRLAVAALLLGLAVAVIGNLIVQWERIRARRKDT